MAAVTDRNDGGLRRHSIHHDLDKLVIRNEGRVQIYVAVVVDQDKRLVHAIVLIPIKIFHTSAMTREVEEKGIVRLTSGTYRAKYFLKLGWSALLIVGHRHILHPTLLSKCLHVVTIDSATEFAPRTLVVQGHDDQAAAPPSCAATLQPPLSEANGLDRAPADAPADLASVYFWWQLQ